MNILFFTRRFHPLIGGVETHVLHISKHLIAKGHNVTIVTEKSSENLPAFEKVEGINVHRISVGKDDWFKKFRIWRQLWKIKKYIVAADVIHCHDVFFWYLPFRFLFLNKHVYITFHGYETICPPAKKSIFIRWLSEKLSNGNICVGDFITKWYGTKSTIVTYGGVDIVPRSVLQEKKTKKSLQIVFIGRLEKDTGSNIYLQTLDRLRSNKIPFTFEVLGDGSQLKRFAQYGKTRGFVDKLDKHIASADIIFVSSYLSMLQAMASRKLVISVYENPLKEDYLRMTPFAKWIVIENDPNTVAEKVIYYQSHVKEKEAMIQNAYEWSAKQTWQKLTETYLRLWNR